MKREVFAMCFVLLLLSFIGLGDAGKCSDPNQTIMQISSNINASGAVWNYGYPEEICYDEIFGIKYPYPNPHNCPISGYVTSGKLLFFSNVTNGLVRVFNYSDYGSYTIAPNNRLCYGDLTCGAVITSPGGCGRTMVRLTNLTNAFLSKPNNTNYSTSEFSYDYTTVYPYSFCCSSEYATRTLSMGSGSAWTLSLGACAIGGPVNVTVNDTMFLYSFYGNVSTGIFEVFEMSENGTIHGIRTGSNALHFNASTPCSWMSTFNSGVYWKITDADMVYSQNGRSRFFFNVSNLTYAGTIGDPYQGSIYRAFEFNQDPLAGTPVYNTTSPLLIVYYNYTTPINTTTVAHWKNITGGIIDLRNVNVNDSVVLYAQTSSNTLISFSVYSRGNVINGVRTGAGAFSNISNSGGNVSYTWKITDADMVYSQNGQSRFFFNASNNSRGINSMSPDITAGNNSIALGCERPQINQAFWVSKDISNVIFRTDTVTTQDACKGNDGAAGTSDDCCPNGGWECANVDGKTICARSLDSAVLCEDYKTEAKCNADKFGVGNDQNYKSNSGGLYDLYKCGQIKVIGGDVFIYTCGEISSGTKNGCAWKNNACWLNVSLQKQISPPSIFQSGCLYKAILGNCLEGYQNVTVIGEPAGADNLVDCADLNGYHLVLCGNRIELPFFGTTQFIIAMLIFVTIYIVIKLIGKS